VHDIETAPDLTKVVRSLGDESFASSKTFESSRIVAGRLGRLLASQAAQTALLDLKDDIETGLARPSDWDEEKVYWNLEVLAGDSFAYRIKPEMHEMKPFHQTCPECYQQNVKSILQKHVSTGGARAFICPHCSTIVYQ
jgi:Zn finger protein HypA/HybF involved in hydrogenase expression